MSFTNTMVNLWNNMGVSTFTWQQSVMIGISLILLFLAIVKKFEPFLLLPIAFSMLLVNLPLTGHKKAVCFIISLLASIPAFIPV